MFSTEETAASQGHSDNPTLANEFVFDWIADRLHIDASQAGLALRTSPTRSNKSGLLKDGQMKQTRFRKSRRRTPKTLVAAE
jgi:hypothetical protein